jgi:DNA polymerase-3 subunit gamma/tau
MVNFVVSARKYRPEIFSAVIGQETITVTLRNAIKTNKIGHAYLFCGPRGVGKTTCARIFAKTINCTDISAGTEACNSCDSCTSFNEMRAFNIHELDAASNNTVDGIRSLNERVRIPPQAGKYSIFIIDEVHMLSAQAFNAFLKTLEEPPSYAIFILATTEKHKIIPTILSRCQIFDFNRIQVHDIVEHLEKIAGKEGVEYELDALNIIALKADGAMRDALSIFDQMVSYSDKKITYQDVIRSLNVLDYDYYFRLTDMFLEGNMSGSLLVFNEILEKGFDGHNFIVGLSGHLRDLLVSKDPETLQLLEVGATIRDNYLKQSIRTDQEFIYKALEICNNADIYYKSSRNQKLHIELALVRLCQITDSKKKTILTPEVLSDDSIIQVKGTKSTEPGSPDQVNGAKSTEPGSPDQVNDPVPETEKPPEAKKSKRIKSEKSESTDQKSAEKEYEKTDPLLQRPKTLPQSYSIRNALNGNDSPPVVPDIPADTPDDIIEIVSDYFTGEELLTAWNEFAEKIKTDKPRMYNTLKGHLPERKDDQSIDLVLDNTIQQDEFQRDIRQDLLVYLKEKLNNELISLTSSVKTEKGKQPRLYTAQEKFDYMLRKNPDLGKLKQEFNLDLD